MFTLQQMKAAHAKVKSGADFPAYVQEIKQLGLLRYEFMVKDGRTIFHCADNFQISRDPAYATKTISAQSSASSLKQIIADTQQGKSDFPTFCSQAADAGVEKWVVDTQKMLCTYYDASGKLMVAEPIPEAY